MPRCEGVLLIFGARDGAALSPTARTFCGDLLGEGLAKKYEAVLLADDPGTC